MNKIPGILRVGVGVGVGAGTGCVQVGATTLPCGKTGLHPLGAGAGASASAGILAEAVRRHQAEIVVPK